MYGNEICGGGSEIHAYMSGFGFLLVPFLVIP